MAEQVEASSEVEGGPADRPRARITAPPRFGSRNMPVAAGATATLVAVAVSAAATEPSLWHGAALVAGLGAACLFRAGGASSEVRLTGGERASNFGGVTARDLLAAVAAPTLAADSRGVVLATNPAMRAIAPLVEIGRPIYLALRQPDLLAAVETVARTGEPQTVPYDHPGSPPRKFEVEVFPLRSRSEAGAPAVVLWFHDRTEMRRMEEMRSDFVANVSHELRTPLASVLGFVETLQGPARNDPKARDQFLGIMADQARRMARLIDDLLSLSRIELREHVRPSGTEDIGLIVAHVADTLRKLAADQNVTLQIASTERPVRVIGDRDELLRVFENLIENAIKYGGTGGVVDVSVEERPPMAVVAVRDRGPGIAPDHLPRLTERFYRVDVATSRGKGGTGLGLAIVKHVIARHGGRLAIESTLGAGAKFIVALPLSDSSPKPAAIVTELSSTLHRPDTSGSYRTIRGGDGH